MQFTFFKNTLKVSIVVSMFFCILLLSPQVFAQNGNGGGSSGGTARPTTRCEKNASKTCYSSWNNGDHSSRGGGEWLKVTISDLMSKYGATNPDAIPYKSINNLPEVEGKGPLDFTGDPQIIYGCGRAESVYVFISHIYNNKPPYTPVGKGYGPNKFKYFLYPDYSSTDPNSPNNKHTAEEKYVHRSQDHHAELSEVEKDFRVYQEVTGRYDVKWEEGDFSWFCAYKKDIPPQPCDPNDPSCNPNPNPNPTPNTTLDCGKDLPGVSDLVYKGNTVADSAIINLSYTGTQKYRDWQRTIYGNNFVLARPGDSIRFRHTMCYTAQGVGKGLTGDPKPNIENRNLCPA